MRKRGLTCSGHPQRRERQLLSRPYTPLPVLRPSVRPKKAGTRNMLALTHSFRLIPPFLPRLSPAGTAAAGGTTVIVHTTTSTRLQTVNAATQRNRRRVTSAASPGLHFASVLTHSHPYHSHPLPSGNRNLVVPLLSPIIISTPLSSARGQIYPCVFFKLLGSLKETNVSVSTLLEFLVV